MKWTNLKQVAVIAVMAWLWNGFARADVTNAIWKAGFTGSLGIQEFHSNVEPYMKVAQWNKKTFLSIILGRTPTKSEMLAVNIDMAQGQTNMFLSVYNQDNRQNEARLSYSETTTLISDGKTFVFSLDAPLLPGSPSSSLSTNWGGGFMRVSGRGRLVNGVPAVLNGAATGVFIDTRPGDLNGTTGLVIRAKIRTSGAPLRIQPAN